MADPRVDVTIGANVQPFASALQTAMGKLQGFLTLGAIAAVAREAIELGGALSDLSAKTQVSVKWLQEVGYAASQTGSSVEELANAVVELRRAQAQALGGSQSDLNAFAQLGITVGDLRSMGAEQLFDRIADSVHRSRGGIQEVNAALMVLGRGGKGLLTGMIDGFSELRDEARRLGLVLENDVINSMDSAGDAIDRLKLRMVTLAAVAVDTVTKLGKVPSIMRSISESEGGWWEFFKRAGSMPGGFGAAAASMVAENAARNAPASSALVSELTTEAGPGGVGVLPTEPQTRRRGANDRPQADSLKRIGGYIGEMSGPGQSLLRVQTSALAELRAHRRLLEKIANRSPGEIISW